MEYIEIKKILLKDENIQNVYVNKSRKQIIVEPIQNKNFYDIREVIENFEILEDDKTYFKIGDRKFRLSDYEYINSLVYEIKLKEVV